MDKAAATIVLLIALIFGLGIAFQLFYPGDCTVIEYMSREILNLDATVCSVETIFSRT